MAMSRLTVAAKRVVPGPPGGSPGSEMSEDASLVAAAANGDAAAFRSLVDRHLSGVLAVARRMLRDDAEAEDVAQEALLRLWRSADGLEVGPQGLRPWLRRVVSNLCVDRMRSGRRLMVVEEVPEPARRCGIEGAARSATHGADPVPLRGSEPGGGRTHHGDLGRGGGIAARPRPQEFEGSLARGMARAACRRRTDVKRPEAGQRDERDWRLEREKRR